MEAPTDKKHDEIPKNDPPEYGNATILDRVSILKPGGASLAIYIVITSFHQLFPPEWQHPYVVRWIACITCLIVSYLFLLQDKYRDKIAYGLMIINGLGMFLSCSGINAIHNDVAQTAILDNGEKKQSYYRGQEVLFANVEFLSKPIDWWQPEIEYRKLQQFDSLKEEVILLRRKIVCITDTIQSFYTDSSVVSSFLKRISSLQDSLKKCNANNSQTNYRAYKNAGGSRGFVAVAPTKMNVLYIGVDNPLKISSPYIKLENIESSMEGAGSIIKNPDGTFTANVSSVGKCSINVFEKSGGAIKWLDSAEFRIKRIPDPVPTLGGKLRGGNTQPGAIRAQSGVVALLENFDFETRFNVQSFQMVFSSKGEIFKAEGQGPLFNAKMKSFLNRAQPKDIIFIDEIKIVGPDKQPRKLGQIAFTII